MGPAVSGLGSSGGKYFAVNVFTVYVCLLKLKIILSMVSL